MVDDNDLKSRDIDISKNFGSTGVGNQGVMLARQVLYHLSHSTS
jgi:hypothetical protein